MQLSNFDVEEVDGGRKREMVRGRQGENDQRGLAKEVVARMLIDQVVLQGGAFFGVGCNFKPSQWVSQRLRGPTSWQLFLREETGGQKRALTATAPRNFGVRGRARDGGPSVCLPLPKFQHQARRSKAHGR
uniref:Uncharacterized protein n=1 Tax=Bionectria ochroleuca TaxID=29856 RepID=A0A8H7NK97_BIOOC